MKDYNIWLDADGILHDIADMDDSHIKNCINLLKRAIRTFYIGKDNQLEKTNNPADDWVLHRNWSIDHALNYLQAFEAELARR